MAQGLPSNLPSDVSRGPLALGIISFAFTLATILVGLRVYVRLKKHAHGWDDYTIYAAWLFAVSGMTLTALEVQNGMGRHVVYILPTLSKLLKVVVLAELGVALGVGFVKLSICIFVLRLIKGTHRRIAIAVYTVMIMNTVITLVAVFCIAFQCTPFEKVWNPKVPGRCFSAQVLTEIVRVVGAFGCITDFMCVIIPVFILNRLQMNRGTKLAMILILSLGLFTAACSIGKAVTSEFISNDFSWQNLDVTIWAALEHMLGIVVACMPTLRPLFANVGKSTRNRWHYWTEKRTSEGSKTIVIRNFDGHKRKFENLEYRSSDRIPMRPIINVRHSTEIECEARIESDMERNSPQQLGY